MSLLEVLLFIIVEYYLKKKKELCLFLISVLDRGEWSALHPSPFIPSKKSQLQEAGGSQSRSGCIGQEKNFLSLLGFELQIIQLVA